jgi:hypothetical protein
MPKNKNATNDVDYSPFDPYDLGDKYQKDASFYGWYRCYTPMALRWFKTWC